MLFVITIILFLFSLGKFCIEHSNYTVGLFNQTSNNCSNSYIQCSGNSSQVPNVLSTGLTCPINQYFSVTIQPYGGSCINSPPSSSCQSMSSFFTFMQINY